ncbi:MAG: leucine--tRNA ligase, partial [Patescibacteria group bacterium]
MAYYHQQVERKWQQFWADHSTFAAPTTTEHGYYCLGMFPYPSGAGLHIGHPKGYVATDIVSRMKRAQGFDVLQPMGWDSFGLPAENYAIKTGVHPRDTTNQAIERFRTQLQQLGLSYDWQREISTSDPSYYKWTQWLFLQLYERGLAYKKEAAVNWCPLDQTVLANEQVVDGKCERCGTQTVQRQLAQWFLKITNYADELLDDLDGLDWPEPIKAMQRNWIGRSEGATITFSLKENEQTIEVFTTRPDTLYGVTYLVLAPEHPLVPSLWTDQTQGQVQSYIQQATAKTELDRQIQTQQKTGVFTGSYAIHPLTGQDLPIWIADYVLATYGTGAVMAVPAHDQRDWDFAHAHQLPIKRVIDGGTDEEVFIGEGLLVNSGEWNGISSTDTVAITESITKLGVGVSTRQYRLRDWLVSRQRYWGPPIPIIYCDACGTQPVPVADLPVLLPDDVDFRPTGESPLARSQSFQQVACPKCGGNARRESDTLDTFVDSSWYFLRYTDPANPDTFAAADHLRSWLPVDMYVGGAEHAVLHLLYARFITKALDDQLRLGFREPFRSLRNQGLIMGEDGRKMSKSL